MCAPLPAAPRAPLPHQHRSPLPSGEDFLLGFFFLFSISLWGFREREQTRKIFLQQFSIRPLIPKPRGRAGRDGGRGKAFSQKLRLGVKQCLHSPTPMARE